MPITTKETPVFTYTDMSATMYGQKSVNVRSLPTTDGEKIGTLSMNQEVTVTGQCNETGWYRIIFTPQGGTSNGSEAFVSNNYLGANKVEVQAEIPSGNGGTDTTAASTNDGEVCPYPLYTIMYDQGGVPYFYGVWGGSANMDADNYAKTEACIAEIDAHVRTLRENGGYTGSSHQVSWESVGTYSGVQIVRRFLTNVEFR